MNVRVGDHRQASVVTINGEVIEAAAGQDSHGGSNGGDGYSGGGAYCRVDRDHGNCDGGSHGGDEEAACNDGQPGGSCTWDRGGCHNLQS